MSSPPRKGSVQPVESLTVEDLGKELRRYREGEQISQMDLARALHTSQEHLSRFERGKGPKKPDRPLLEAMRRAVQAGREGKLAELVTRGDAPVYEQIGAEVAFIDDHAPDHWSRIMEKAQLVSLYRMAAILGEQDVSREWAKAAYERALSVRMETERALDTDEQLAQLAGRVRGSLRVARSGEEQNPPEE